MPDLHEPGNMVVVFPFTLLPAAEVDTAFWMEKVSADERIRAERTSHLETRNRFLQCRAILRSLLGYYTGNSPYLFPFLYKENGKPAMQHAPLHFNLSHSGQFAIIAISKAETPQAEIGIDLELLRPVPHALTMADRFFHPQEKEELARLSVSEQEAAFLRTWVRKEACLKAIGLGIEDTLKKFSTVYQDKPVTLEQHPSIWWHDLAIAPSHFATLACTHHPCNIKLAALQSATDLMSSFRHTR